MQFSARHAEVLEGIVSSAFPSASILFACNAHASLAKRAKNNALQHTINALSSSTQWSMSCKRQARYPNSYELCCKEMELVCDASNNFCARQSFKLFSNKSKESEGQSVKELHETQESEEMWKFLYREFYCVKAPVQTPAAYPRCSWLKNKMKRNDNAKTKHEWLPRWTPDAVVYIGGLEEVDVERIVAPALVKQIPTFSHVPLRFTASHKRTSLEENSNNNTNINNNSTEQLSHSTFIDERVRLPGYLQRAVWSKNTLQSTGCCLHCKSLLELSLPVRYDECAYRMRTFVTFANPTNNASTLNCKRVDDERKFARSTFGYSTTILQEALPFVVLTSAKILRECTEQQTKPSSEELSSQVSDMCKSYEHGHKECEQMTSCKESTSCCADAFCLSAVAHLIDRKPKHLSTEIINRLLQWREEILDGVRVQDSVADIDQENTTFVHRVVAAIDELVHLMQRCFTKWISKENVKINHSEHKKTFDMRNEQIFIRSASSEELQQSISLEPEHLEHKECTKLEESSSKYTRDQLFSIALASLMLDELRSCDEMTWRQIYCTNYFLQAENFSEIQKVKQLASRRHALPELKY